MAASSSAIPELDSPTPSLSSSSSADEGSYSFTAHPPSTMASASAPDPPSLTALLLSLRVMLLSHLADVESRIANFDASSLPKLFGGSPSDILENSPAAEDNIGQDGALRKSRRMSRTASEEISTLLESIRADVARHLPALDIDFELPSLPDFDLPTLPALHLPESLFDTIRAHSPSLPSNFIPSLKHRLQSLASLAATPPQLQTLLSYAEKVPLAMDEFESSSEEELLSKREGRAKGEEGVSATSDEEDVHEQVPLIVGGSKTTRAEVRRALVRSINGDRLIRFEDLPHKWKNNEFIHTGYRFIPFSRWPLLAASLFQWHNETINILSHLLPTVLFPLISLVPIPNLPLPTYFWPSWLEMPDVTIDVLPYWYFWSAAACCLACSVIWHTMAGCSDMHVCEWGARVDYVGIGWLISASITSAIYYGFYCDPHTAAIYAAFSILTGALGTVLPFMHWFNQRKNKKWRIAFFVTCALSALLFFAHLSLEHGIHATGEFYAPIVPSVAAYTFGLCFYAWHFPECAFPGRFDYIGASHQIWHISIVAAIWLHYRAIASWHVGALEYACAAP
ncbi:HlyIII-domain-containing protein [Dacryopinax primogenitus]|uniref:HlyIII-domain-containing protein n=1 Tax=Dacryopinax primogenitus (strain DJM 731) TaxID=1858805 RepID=M5G0R8_DACPD|nr:HlyIII-domain-containing protein [Dacryopinax primogenitus]EJT97392.1 HlyIII-domain-containing protein [Dacryopinax primogenitus]